jgi:hypothetical protein
LPIGNSYARQVRPRTYRDKKALCGGFFEADKGHGAANDEPRRPRHGAGKHTRRCFARRSPYPLCVSETAGIHHGGVEGEHKEWKTREADVLPVEHVSWAFDVKAPDPPAPAQETEAEKRLLSIMTDIRSLLMSARWFVIGAVALQWKK